MQSVPGPMLSKLTEHWKERGWSLASLAQFRMEDPPAPPAPTPPAPTPPAPPAPPEPAFPPNTPVVEMTIEQQAAYWKHQSRKHEARATERQDYDDIKAKADQYDTLLSSTKSEHEREVETARTEEAARVRTEENAKLAPRLVDAEMRAAAAGKIEPERLAGFIENIDRSKFLTDTGEVDLEKVATFVAGIAPAPTNDANGKPFPILGQGRHASGGKPSVTSGADRYAAKHPSKT